MEKDDSKIGLNMESEIDTNRRVADLMNLESLKLLKFLYLQGLWLKSLVAILYLCLIFVMLSTASGFLTGLKKGNIMKRKIHN
jgi:hypothetical protein